MTEEEKHYKKAADIVVGDVITGLYYNNPMRTEYIEGGGARRVKHVAKYPDDEHGTCFVFSVEEGEGMYMVPAKQEIEVVK